jgi:phage terminase large subunit-like protein
MANNMSSTKSGSASTPRGLLPNKLWEPTFYVPRKYKQTDGDELIDFAENHFTVLKGFRAGDPLVFTNWQKWLLRSLFERNEEGRLRYRRALIGLPRKNGKSLMGSTIAVYSMIAGEAGAEVYAVAGDRQQARIIFNEAKQQVQNSPMLSEITKVYRDALEMPAFGSVFRVLSSEFKSQAGLNPSTVLFDELWNQRDSELYDQMTLGSGARLEPMTISITTAGFDLDTPAGKLYTYGKRCAAGEVADDGFGFWWWEAKADCAIDDKTQWNKANPNVAEKLLSKEDLATASVQTAESAFRRWRLNQWVRTQESWLPMGAWEACTSDEELDTELPVWVGIDMALKHDSVAVVVAQPQGENVVVRAQIWNTSEEGVDVAEVEAHLRALHYKYQVKEFAYDPAYFQRSAEALLDDGLPMLEFPQNGQRMVPACGHAYEMIVQKRLIHDGQPSLTDHVLSAAQRITDNGWRLSKNKSRRKIDACIAMVMAVDRATRRPPPDATPNILNIWN